MAGELFRLVGEGESCKNKEIGGHGEWVWQEAGWNAILQP